MNHEKNDVVLLANKYSMAFAQNIFEILKNKDINFSLESIDSKSYPDGNRFVQVGQNVRNNPVFVIQSYVVKKPLRGNWDLLLTADALKRCGAKNFKFFVSYMDGRQDTKKDGRVAITAKMVADLLDTAGGRRYEGFSTVNMHSPQQMGFFDVSADNLDAMPLFGWYIKNKLFKKYYDKKIVNENLVVVSPDAGRNDHARRFSELLGCGFSCADKTRSVFDKGCESKISGVGGDLRGKIALIIDDIFDSGGTLEGNAKFLKKENGVKDIYCFFTHCLASEKKGVKAEDRMKKIGVKAITTDTVPRDKEYLNENKDWLIAVLSVSPIVAEFIYRDVKGLSVSEMFRDERIIEELLKNLDQKLFLKEAPYDGI